MRNTKKTSLILAVFLFLFALAPGKTRAQNTLEVSLPAAGQVWPLGNTQTISWSNVSANSSGAVSPAVDIDLNPVSNCSGTNSTSSCPQNTSIAPYIIALNTQTNNNSYIWAVPETLPQSYLGADTISISYADSSASGVSSQFTIVPANANISSTPITAPNGGEQWTNGSTETIQWSNSTSSPASVNIELIPFSEGCATSGCPSASSTPIIIASGVPGNQNYSWSINNIPSGQYQVSIINPATNSPLFSSAGFFTVSGQTNTPTTSTSTLLTITGLNPSTGPVGTTVNIIGLGFSPTGNTVQFGSGTYIPNLLSANGTAIQFTVPSQTQPCPPNSTNPCPLLSSALITPRAYGVSVTNHNGSSNSVPFEVASGTAPSGIINPGGSALPPTLGNGDVVILPGSSTVYFINNNVLEPFSNPKIFLAMGYQWSQVQPITPAQFDQFTLNATPVMAPSGSIIKSIDNPTIYLVISGQKSPIPSMTVFKKLGLNINNLITMGAKELENYPTIASEQ